MLKHSKIEHEALKLDLAIVHINGEYRKLFDFCFIHLV